MKRLILILLLLCLTLCGCARDSLSAESDSAPTTGTIPVPETAPVTENQLFMEVPSSTEPWTLFETVFLPFACGQLSPELDQVTEYLDRLGYEWSFDEGMLSVEDPEHPGSYLSGSPSGDNIGRLSYHYVIQQGLHIDETIQRVAMADIRSGQPQYYINVDWMGEGTQVETPEEMAAYMMIDGLRPEETPEGIYRSQMTAVLTNAGNFLSNDLTDPVYHSADLTLGEYLEALNQETGFSLTFSKIAAVDMDDDGFKEVALHISMTDYDVHYNYLLLHFADNRVRGQFFYYGEMFELKTDGSFGWIVYHHGNGAARMIFEEGNWHREEISDEGFEEKEDVQWFPYPCDDLSELLN